jgi:hypothetical protein
MHISFAKRLRAVVATKGDVKSAVAQHLLDDPEVVHYLKTSRLKAFALRSDEIFPDLIDYPKLHAAPSEITCQSQPGWAGSHDQNLNVVCCHVDSRSIVQPDSCRRERSLDPGVILGFDFRMKI